MPDVWIAKCADYAEKNVDQAMRAAVADTGALNFVVPGMTVGIKVNLVSAMRPDAAATTHPMLVAKLTELLLARGAKVILGDSPGGLYNAAFVNRAYTVCGMQKAEECGAQLNRDFSQKEARYAEGLVLRQFHYTRWLDDCDAIINFCKLKTHGMMGMSCAVKNMFGVIPGMMKPEFHYQFPKHEEFASMLIDLNDYFKPRLNIVDAVIGMEGNGPTAGVPRKIGAIIAGESPHAVDLVCAKIIGLSIAAVPTLKVAARHGKISESLDALRVEGPLAALVLHDFQCVTGGRPVEFDRILPGKLGKIAGYVARRALESRPVLQKDLCVGCGKCSELCAPKAITMQNGLPRIDRRKCIRCFCCQEFCPKGAMRVKRTAIARVLSH